MTCDVKHGMCRRNDGDFLIWVETVKPVDHTVSARVLELSHSKNQDENDIAPIYRNEERKVAKKIECPGGNQTCADSYTCCETPSGDYACCPMVEAVCCSDHIHCCPKGSSCDTHAGRCTRVRHLWPKQRILGFLLTSVIDVVKIWSLEHHHIKYDRFQIS